MLTSVVVVMAMKAMMRRSVRVVEGSFFLSQDGGLYKVLTAAVVCDHGHEGDVEVTRRRVIGI